MLIRINDLPSQGLIINDTISLQDLNKRMSEGRNNDICFLEAPKVELLVEPTTGGAKAVGKLSTRYSQPCSLCGDDREHNLSVDIDLVLKPKRLGDDYQGRYEDDVGIFYYQGDNVDLEDPIQEALILALNPFQQPEWDQNERCLDCGRTRQEILSGAAEDRASLGDLLCKAGIKIN